MYFKLHDAGETMLLLLVLLLLYSVYIVHVFSRVLICLLFVACVWFVLIDSTADGIQEFGKHFL